MVRKSHCPIGIKAMGWFTSRKSGVNAVNLQDLLGFGGYQTAWTWFHKLRRCTIRQGRERLSGRVEVDEFYIGGQKPGKRGRGSNGRTIVVAAVQKNDHEFGRIRLQVIPDCSSKVLQAFINKNIAPDSTIVTDGWKGYNAIDPEKYAHKQQVAEHIEDKDSILPGVPRITSLVKRMMLGTFQGRFGPCHLQSYLDEYVFRFNRRKSRFIG
ncbi:MAG: IS1595 family transposase [Desulfosarcinaceae bacterium]